MTDKDRIFPLDGIVRLHSEVRKVYDLYDVPDKLGLLVTEGPHKDTQELQVPVMRWFNKWLKNDDATIRFRAITTHGSMPWGRMVRTRPKFLEKLASRINRPEAWKVLDFLQRDRNTYDGLGGKLFEKGFDRISCDGGIGDEPYYSFGYKISKGIMNLYSVRNL